MKPEERTEHSLTLTNLIEYCKQNGMLDQMSDFQLTVGSHPFIRIGDFRELSAFPVVTSQQNITFAASLMTKEQAHFFAENHQVEIGLERDGVRFRISVYSQRGTIAIALRRIKDRIPTLKELHMPVWLKDFGDKNSGLLVLSGPAGGGKTTTATSILTETLSRKKGLHLVTVEDPVEYLIPSGQGIVDQREIGTDVLSFQDAMRVIVRENPNIIFLGEIRDGETAQIALSLATTGHLVLTTIHAFPATAAINRMVSFLSDKNWSTELFSESFVAIVAQTLIKTKFGSYPIVEVVEHSLPVQHLIAEGKLPEICNYMNTPHSRTIKDSLQLLQSSGIIEERDRERLMESF
jgi:twitching motility protein PilT